jgi:hypothetical protein
MFSRIRWGCVILLFLVPSVVGARLVMTWTPPANPPRVDGLQRAPSAKPPKPVEQLNLDGAVPVTVPVPTQDLTAASFSTPDGKQGWVLKIPGGRPIATPAYANGKLFMVEK